LESILSVLNVAHRDGRTSHPSRTPQAVRIDSERWLVALFLLVFAAGVILAAVQTARLGLALAFGV
jgi:MFS superfamily sulfate permease-like transporter